MDCCASECDGSLGCVRARKKFIEEITSANGKPIEIDGKSAYMLDDGRRVFIGRAWKRCTANVIAEGWIADTGKEVIIVGNHLYFAAGKDKRTAEYCMNKEKLKNPHKALISVGA